MTIMSSFDPFARHRVESQPVAEAIEIDPKSTAEAPAVEPKPIEGKHAARASNPFGHHKIEPKARPELERARNPPAQALLDWLQRWDKQTIRLRDIQIFGPMHIRKREIAIEQAAVLVKYNWLIPIKSNRRDSLEWKIVRAPIILPTIDTVPQP
jgi:hypothetical protein